MSELPAWLAWPLGFASIIHGIRLSGAELGRPRMQLTLDASAAVRIDGVAVDAFRVRWRGPIAFVKWTDAQGRVERYVLAPDVLTPAARRELRLAWSAHAAALGGAAVAP